MFILQLIISLKLFSKSNFVLSTKTLPAVGYNKPINISTKVLFPLPVLPIIPILSPFLILKLILLITLLLFWEYLKLTSLNIISLLNFNLLNCLNFISFGIGWFNNESTEYRADLFPLRTAQELYIIWEVGNNLWAPKAIAPKIGSTSAFWLFSWTNPYETEAIIRRPKASSIYLGEIEIKLFWAVSKTIRN